MHEALALARSCWGLLAHSESSFVRVLALSRVSATAPQASLYLFPGTGLAVHHDAQRLLPTMPSRGQDMRSPCA